MCLDAIENLKVAGEAYRNERDRLRNQLNQAEDEISRVRHSCNQYLGECEKVRSQVHSTQSYIRNLEQEESKIGDKLSNLED